MSEADPIDAVYTWVDGSRADYLEVVNRHAAIPRDVNPERFRDALEMLRFSLRSLEMHAPWIRNVYLVTCRPQVPDWVRRDHPRLRIVHHDQIIPDDGTLPTFNSNVIETFLHRLPGVSERMLYLNDDYLFGAPVSRDDFFAPDGRLRVFGTLVGEHFRSRIVEHQILSFGLVEHGPILIDRQEWAAAMEAAPEIRESRTHRFRRPDDIRPERLYRWHLLTHARDRSVPEPFWTYLPKSAFHKIEAGVARQRRALAKIDRRRPKFICLNDDLGDQPDREVIAEVRSFLLKLFPRPSSYELTSGRPGDSATANPSENR